MRGVIVAVLFLGVGGPGAANRLSAAGPEVTLGAEAEAFSAKFGKPVKDVGPAKFYGKCAGSESGGKWGVTFPIQGTLKEGFHFKASSIERVVCGSERLDAAISRKEALSLMPADAAPVREFRTADGRQAQEYRSKSLGKVFPAEAFLTCDAEGRTQKIPEGTFSYAMARDGRSWNLILGTCF